MRTRLTRHVSPRFLVGAVLAAWLASAGLAVAQTPFVPYYGKNLVRWNRFDWRIYATEHFEIFYYPEIESHLERVAGYAESAYQRISSDLKHDLAFKIPLIIFKTHAEFEQQNVIPGAAQEGVAAFAESSRDRMLLPLDEPPDLLYRLITHELAHIFQFDIIPQSIMRATIPLWVSEGHSDYVTGYWSSLDLATVRDAAVADVVPKMTELEGYGSFSNPRLIYNLGHVVFEFIESRWGREGVRQFLFSLRKSVVGGGENAFEEAFRLRPEEFDQQFEKYLKDRFKAFRDKERPADYGQNLAPNPEKGPYTQALSIEPSPSGDLIATVTANRNDREYDIVLLSAKDGSVVRNLTAGFDKDLGIAHLAIPGTRWNAVHWLSWSPNGDQLAYFARTENYTTLIVQNVVTGKVERRFRLKDYNEPESPSFTPDGGRIAFSAMQNAKSNIYVVDLESGEVTNLTSDEFFNYAPTVAPDGRSIVFMSRVSGNEKLFRLDLDTKKRTQITFGTHDDGSARFLDDDTIIFPSTAVDPSQPIDPELSKNGSIYNLWTLGLKTGELKQYTDAVAAITSPVVLDREKRRVAFVSYYKGDYWLNTLELKASLHDVESSDFGAPGPIIDFQAPLTHTLVAANQRKKSRFEKLFLEGRPPIAAGVTSSGNFYGGTEIALTDVLGDHRISAIFASISQYRTLAGSYVNQSHRFIYALQGYSQTQFYYGQSSLFYDPAYSYYIDRDLAVATRSYQGGSIFGIYPLDTFRRLEVSAGVVRLTESFNDPALDAYSQQYQQQQYGQTIFQSGMIAPISIALVQETTVFREFGPLAGNTIRLGYEIAPPVSNWLSRQTVDLDLRYYLRLTSNSLLALRTYGFKSWGSAPSFTYFGGNSELRGYEYLEFLGQNAVFANAELRFPIIEAALTPIGVVGGVRGTLFFNIGGAWYDGTGYQFFSDEPETFQPLIGYYIDEEGFPRAVYGDPVTISGFRLRDGRASYGISLSTFALGIPMHFDWSWRTLFDKTWSDTLYGSEWRKPRFQFWIGYDF